METTPNNLTMTEQAAAQVAKLLTAEGMDRAKGALRIKVIGGGCSGYSYDMYLDDEVGEEDIITEAHGVRLITDEMSLTFIEGTEVDFVQTLTSSGFKFNNPKAEDTCGCGISFKA